MSSKEQKRRWVESKKGKELERRRARRRSIERRTGLTEDGYYALLESQQGVCAICRKAETRVMHGKVTALCVDHDHTTGRIRGIICHSCNYTLSRLGDNWTSAKHFFDYLKRAEEGAVWST